HRSPLLAGGRGRGLAMRLEPRAAGRQRSGLADPLLAVDAAGKGQIGPDPTDFRPRPSRDLIEMEDAEFVQSSLIDRADAFDALQIVGLVGARRGKSHRTGADGIGL